MKIIKASVEHVDLIAPLFDAYRQFYQQPGDTNAAKSYIHDRLSNDESTIFLALTDNQAVGFTQLYPSFCSVEMIKILVLYDLFVKRNARGTGVGYALLEQARQQALNVGAGRIDLQTAQDNHTAQNLYKKFGYRFSNEFQNWNYYPTV